MDTPSHLPIARRGDKPSANPKRLSSEVTDTCLSGGALASMNYATSGGGFTAASRQGSVATC